jgi:hypothetical protein
VFAVTVGNNTKAALSPRFYCMNLGDCFTGNGVKSVNVSCIVCVGAATYQQHTCLNAHTCQNGSSRT